MAENPLLPHRKLQELYTLMERTRLLERKHKQTALAREALLAAAVIQLEPGDLVSAAAADKTAAALAPAAKHSVAGAKTFTVKLPRLALVCATARGMQAAASGTVLVLASGAEPGWAEAFTWAQSERLPVIFLLWQDGSRKRGDAIAWPAVSLAAAKVKIPVLTVDGEDAVAVFRCAQEAALRARTAAGPSVIWAELGVGGGLSPMARLKRYMAARDIPLPR